jgi:hypothetical protein
MLAINRPPGGEQNWKWPSWQAGRRHPCSHSSFPSAKIAQQSIRCMVCFGFLNVINSFDLFAGTDGHDHGWSTALMSFQRSTVYHQRVLRDLRRLPRCRGKKIIQKIIERSRNQQETTTFLSAYNRLKPTLLERRLSETKSPTLYINSLVLCLVAFAIGGSREEHLL